MVENRNTRAKLRHRMSRVRQKERVEAEARPEYILCRSRSGIKLMAKLLKNTRVKLTRSIFL